jgi:hypothetical protein
MDNKLFKQFCDKVVTLDKSIRFIGIADGHGRLLATAERKGIIPLQNNTPLQQQQGNIHESDGKKSWVKYSILVLTTTSC